MSTNSANTDKVDIDSLSEDDKNRYLSERLKKFKLTIMICVLYGLIAVIMLIVAYFTSWGKKFLYDEMLAFVVTFVIGTIIIIVYLANEVYAYKPIVDKAALGYDSETCPDYWKLVNANEDIVRKDTDGKSYFSSQVNKYQFKYRCELDDKIMKKDTFGRRKLSDGTTALYNKSTGDQLYRQATKENTFIKEENDFNKFKEIVAQMSGYTYDSKEKVVTRNSLDATRDKDGNHFTADNVPIACDKVYPMYLAVADKEYKDKNPDGPDNKFRCAYAKACKIDWTDAGCVVDNN